MFVQYREQLGKSSWLPLPTSVERVKLMHGDAWWVIALSTRPLVLLRGLVWSFIYTPFCSGFQNSFPSSLQSNYKARPPSMAGMLNKEKDHWFGCSLQKQSKKKKKKEKREKLHRFNRFGLLVGLVNRLRWAWQLRRERWADGWMKRQLWTNTVNPYRQTA